MRRWCWLLFGMLVIDGGRKIISPLTRKFAVVLVSAEFAEDEEMMNNERYDYNHDNKYDDMGDEEDRMMDQMLQKEEEERLKTEEEKKLLEEERRREAAFQAELEKRDEQQRKALLKQKAKDGKVVKRILKSQGNHYQVLGLRTPFFKALVLPDGWKVGPFQLWQITPSQIKKAYRTMAKRVHPDKNRDGRAAHAFRLVEESATQLLNDDFRLQYNEELKQRREQQIATIQKHLQQTIHRITSTAKLIFTFIKTIFGPFTIPILILTAILL